MTQDDSAYDDHTPDANHAPLFILGVGAGGLDATRLAEVLDAVAGSPDLAVMLLLRDQQLLDKARLRELLGPQARLLLVPEDGDRLQPGRFYLPPNDTVVTLEEGTLRLRPLNGESDHGLIDSFFVSMAHDQDGNVIGLIVGRTDGDGTLGTAAIKECGGLALAVDDPSLHELDLRSASNPAAITDDILPLARVAARIAAHMQRHHSLGHAVPAGVRNGSENDQLSQVASILRNTTGHDFHGYKRATFLRRVQRRMQVVQVEALEQYLDVLRSHFDEPLLLFNDLLIGVTQFFRDHREFEFLEQQVIPRLFQGKHVGDHLRVWVLGCSTGEEAYSLAMLLREHAETLDAPPRIQIFASDIDGRALATARVGRYSSSIVGEVAPERLRRWFVKEGDTYVVRKELRELCVFSQHSIVKDPPFSRLDLVSCRNLLIYLDAELQNRVIPIFHFALKPGGYLFLGNAENVSRHAKLFVPVERSFRVFQKIDADSRVHATFPTLPRAPTDRVLAPPQRQRASSSALVRAGERIADHYAPAYAVLDEHFDVLHFSAQAGRFIRPGGGAPSLNLLNLIHRDLRLDLRSALSRAEAEKMPVQIKGIQVHEDSAAWAVDLFVEPTSDSEVPRGYVVLFQEVEVRDPLELAGPRDAAADRGHVQVLENELRITRERLQSMIEELESTNEELKSSNEEYQSLNEELQSANEELETSKEELQSVNEEVTTVNGELAHRVQELAHANSDLKNLLESTQIATLFLDNELRVTNFTPAITDILPLVESDIHRPISHIKLHVAYDELQDDVRRVIRTLAVLDREVENPATHARYMVRVLPYRTVDNFIGGAVLTFTDVTPLTRAERALRSSEQRLRTLMEGIPQLVWRSHDGGNWTWSSPQWSSYTGLSDADSLQLGWLQAVHPDERELTMTAWCDSARTGGLDVEHRLFNASERGYRWFHTRSTAVRDERGQVLEWLGTSTESDNLRRLQEQQRVLVTELQHRTRNLITVVQSVAKQTMQSSQSMPEFAGKFEDRLSALSRVQGLLSQSDNEPTTIGALLRMELAALGAEPDHHRIVVEGPDVALRKSTVQTLALALHELATNALKYGALAVDTGTLAIRWNVVNGGDASAQLVLQWVEEGANQQLRNDRDQAGGFGRRLIEKALPYSHGAHTRYELSDTRLECEIRLPLNPLHG
ncbi:CheR family methyltransferase [Xanthomonas vesicatoria]|uniref:CheR family methyltransferase n=1 Tax=Xanthomonas vesicatoria TaxID=56460 RepID=UPI00073224AB|nr:CheR family methyltransferase [Xanthomonas vesicatoria]KTF37702.1 methyltransferase [Xanthomonas vesicatoria]MCC8559412.1 PAS domain-containing protein [Xanthomonas vesicatoria]MCC8602388.1 PAS domain-containing protein [Xanthomonas vesicatoria]MCC8610821.1 PAS domain-containing protein [Xanthomonas vesicatoria]MCC8672644.1 PAS domain-containing protein [Xanthomonas vesicatoria]